LKSPLSAGSEVPRKKLPGDRDTDRLNLDDAAKPELKDFPSGPGVEKQEMDGQQKVDAPSQKAVHEMG